MTRDGRKKWALLAALVLSGAVYAANRLSGSRQYQLFGEIVSRVDLAEPVVALTLDDGPSAEHTDEVLALLREKGVRATFFLIGQAVVRHPAEARRIVLAGHEVGNHSYTHARMMFQSRGWMREEITLTDAALRAAGWDRTPLFRPPYGKKLFNLPWVLGEMGRPSITWDLAPDADHVLRKSPAAMVDHVVRQARPGSIILLHVMDSSGETSRAALGPIVDGLRGKGFAFVTVSELLARRK